MTSLMTYLGYYVLVVFVLALVFQLLWRLSGGGK